MTRLAIFTSVSTPAQAAVEKDSLPSQLRDGHTFAASIGATVVATYQVPGHTRKYIFYTDAETDIPAYAQLRADCAAHTFDVLWCRARDRLGRTDALIAQIEAIVTAAGAEVYSALLPHPLGQPSEASTLYLSAVERAQAQVENIQRTRRRDIGIRARVRRGLPHCRWPYGYRPIKDPDGHTIAGEFVPGEIEAVRLATGLFLAGLGIHTIARRLNATPYKPRRSPRWAMTSVRNILYNDRYAGLITYGPHLVATDPSPAYPAAWDPATHRAILQERARRRRGGHPRVSPISGLVVCNRCGCAMELNHPHRHYNYRCYTHANRRALGRSCHTNTIRAATLLDAIQQTLLSLRDPTTLDALLAGAAPGRAPLEAQRAHLLVTIAALKQKRERLALAFADQTMTADVYRDADDLLLNDLQTATRQLTDVGDRLATQPTPEDHRAALEDLLATLTADPGWLRTGPVDQVHAALARTGLRLYIENGHLLRITITPGA